MYLINFYCILFTRKYQSVFFYFHPSQPPKQVKNQVSQKGVIMIALRSRFAVALIVGLLLLPATAVSATDGLTAITGARKSPAPIPHTSVLDNATIQNNLLSPPPAESIAANDADKGRQQEKPGRGIRQTLTGYGQGITLYATANACNNFNNQLDWALPPQVSTTTSPRTDVFSNWYAGWAPFAKNSGLYQAKNTVFAAEQVVGPGNKFGKNQYSAKISSHQPYAGGFGSPMISVAPGAQVTVYAKYLIFDHDTGGKSDGADGRDYDWASMGLKPDAAGPVAEYVNGWVRGEWAEMRHTITAGASGKIMVLLQGSSPAALNSNIYFDDVAIVVDGKPLTSCIYE
jgi:hypothetical protein